MRRIIYFLMLIFAVSACQQKAAETKPQNVKPTANVAPTLDNSKAKTYKSKGVVTKINLELVSVELNHEKIEDFMPAMQMEFYVKEKSELEVLKVGDKVEFVLEDNQGQEKIISIKKIQ